MVAGLLSVSSRPCPVLNWNSLVSILNNLCYYWAGSIRWYQHLVHMEYIRSAYNVLVGNIGVYLKTIDVNGIMTLITGLTEKNISEEDYGRNKEIRTISKKKQNIYRVIHTSLRDFRTRLPNNQDRQGRKEHINR